MDIIHEIAISSFIAGVLSSYFIGIIVSLINYLTELALKLKRERKNRS